MGELAPNFRTLVTLNKIPESVLQSCSDPDERLRRFFHHREYYCAYLQVPSDFDISDKKIEEIDLEITLQQSNILGLDFAHLSDMDADGYYRKDLDKVRQQLKTLYTALTS